VDILVNSAGINIPERTWGLVKPEGWDEVVRVNLDGTFYCCQAVLPSMRARKDGIVINVSSWFGKHITALAGPGYTASKFGVAAMTETINVEEGVNGIRACTICPGEAATPIMDRRPVKPPPHELERMLQEEDLGRVILFIATLPPRVCVNEIIISPTHNRFYVGGLESATPAKPR
jgi:NADP-dependent 3-hydroxy acid dehydrogenase YdfG